ncbi:hypothetical protein [Vallitalea guaymasensis]|uniref:hypothetical protein n=1 Tax=Vallitalea guaymasensis TaxID=1185412 RepID=UPI000DE280B6|nr:hypothetical protein [Vallitalea guaymasensis]
MDNPYNLLDIVSKDTFVYSIVIAIVNEKVYLSKDFNWKSHQDIPCLTLDDIKKQISQDLNEKDLHITLWTENGLFGVIYETGNYSETSDWHVHGITKGYA